MYNIYNVTNNRFVEHKKYLRNNCSKLRIRNCTLDKHLLI